MNISLVIKNLFPDADPLKDFRVQDDSCGKGPYIAAWNVIEPNPTPDQKEIARQNAIEKGEDPDQAVLLKAIPTEEELQAAWLKILKTEKIATFNIRCEDTIEAGFTSAVTGHTYRFNKDEDQGNFTQQVLLMTIDQTIQTVDWKTQDAGVITHTRQEFLTIALQEANNHKRSNIVKYWTLKAQVLAASTEEELAVIDW